MDNIISHQIHDPQCIEGGRVDIVYYHYCNCSIFTVQQYMSLQHRDGFGVNDWVIKPGFQPSSIDE